MEMTRLEKLLVNSDFCNFLNKKLIFPPFFEFIGKNLEGKALEIGCGIGITSHLLSKRYKGLAITAIDYDREQIKIAGKHKKTKNIKFQQGDGTNLKFRNSSFDYVIETNVFHHIKNYPKAIKEVHRVLKTDGTFYLTDISKYGYTWPLSLLFPPESVFTKKKFAKELENNGFRVEKSAGRLFFKIAARRI